MAAPKDLINIMYICFKFGWSSMGLSRRSAPSLHLAFFASLSIMPEKVRLVSNKKTDEFHFINSLHLSATHMAITIPADFSKGSKGSHLHLHLHLREMMVYDLARSTLAPDQKAQIEKFSCFVLQLSLSISGFRS